MKSEYMVEADREMLLLLSFYLLQPLRMANMLRHSLLSERNESAPLSRLL